VLAEGSTLVFVFPSPPSRRRIGITTLRESIHKEIFSISDLRECRLGWKLWAKTNQTPSIADFDFGTKADVA
jgi:hypothetical protein